MRKKRLMVTIYTVGQRGERKPTAVYSELNVIHVSADHGKIKPLLNSVALILRVRRPVSHKLRRWAIWPWTRGNLPSAAQGDARASRARQRVPDAAQGDARASRARQRVPSAAQGDARASRARQRVPSAAQGDARASRARQRVPSAAQGDARASRARQRVPTPPRAMPRTAPPPTTPAPPNHIPPPASGPAPDRRLSNRQYRCRVPEKDIPKALGEWKVWFTATNGKARGVARYVVLYEGFRDSPENQLQNERKVNIAVEKSRGFLSWINPFVQSRVSAEIRPRAECGVSAQRLAA